ncbi:heterokaryon incompatibility protein-domain-containing protein, partial [Phaeosphaeriaceae sp. PMI808]
MADKNIAGPRFNYESLSSANKEIRLLEVSPGVGSDTIRCTIKHVSLLEDLPPVYETVSYCWGSPNKISVIIIDGSVVPVPASSEASIRRMRLPSSPRILWIDAVCIDQSSSSERSQQVALMSMIYSTGKRNLVYLVYKTLYDERTLICCTSNEDFAGDIDFAALKNLYGFAWFRRLWVVQEASLASSSTCHWGELEFELLDALRAAKWLDYKASSLPFSLVITNGLRCASLMWAFIDPLITQLGEGMMAALLNLPLDFEKTEPRDGVFAILGLLGTKLLDRGLPTLLEVDYDKPLPEVLQDATRYALYENRSLMTLYLIQRPVKQEIVPRDFSLWTVRADLQREPGFMPLLAYSIFRANYGLREPSLLNDMSHGADILLGEGFIVDIVREATFTW